MKNFFYKLNFYKVIHKHIYLIILFLFVLPFTASHSHEKKTGTYYSFDKLIPDTSKIIPLQPFIDNASPGDSIVLKPGFYSGPVIVNKKNIVLDGKGKVIVSGMGKGSVFYIIADGVHIRNLKVINSGRSHDQIDCGFSVRGNFNIIENCRIQECLFGLDIQNAKFNKVLHCDISSKTDRSLAFKGDAIRLWYSKHNIVKHCYWHNVRDMVVWYSAENIFEGNKGVGNRYSIHFMYSHGNKILNNEFYKNSVGVFLMYSEETLMIGNTIMQSNGTSGMCLGMKETSSNQILNNRFIYSAVGIHIDVSPFVPSKINTIENNEIAFCGSAIQFHSNQEGNLIKHNFFHDNLTQVSVNGKTASRNKWINNYFDDYQGFDRNGDNIGDTPYRLYSYVEHLWTFNENVKFFYGAPILAVIDFLERLAPFSKPKFILKDKKPLFKWKNME